MSLLSIRNVSKQYAAHKALSSVSMEIPKGQIFGLLGPNGAGKTTLIRIITKITGPDEGEILFDGHALADDHIFRIGYLPEERGLYKKMEIGEQMLYFARLKGLGRAEATKRINYWFDKFEINSWKTKKVEDLSKGMQQKVQFVATVLHEPALLILDEPFTGFDPINANLIKNEIIELKKKGTTVIFSTHRMESVEEMCDHIALINKSRKILDGDIHDIRKQFSTNSFNVEMAQGFEPEKISGSDITVNKTFRKENGNLILEIAIPSRTQSNEILRNLITMGHVLSFSENVPSINDIFISLVEQDEPKTMGQND